VHALKKAFSNNKLNPDAVNNTQGLITMNAAAEENGFHVSSTHTSKLYYWTFGCNHSLPGKFNTLKYTTHNSEPI
jgi:hypothetical protein